MHNFKVNLSRSQAPSCQSSCRVLVVQYLSKHLMVSLDSKEGSCRDTVSTVRCHARNRDSVNSSCHMSPKLCLTDVIITPRALLVLYFDYAVRPLQLACPTRPCQCLASTRSWQWNIGGENGRCCSASSDSLPILYSRPKWKTGSSFNFQLINTTMCAKLGSKP